MLDFPLRLAKNELDVLEKGRGELPYKTEEECKQYFTKKVLDLLARPAANPRFKGLTNDQIFFHLTHGYDLLCLGYYLSLKDNDPRKLLDALYTSNLMTATYHLSGGYDHCLRLKKVLMSYAGNDYELVDYLLPESIALSKIGTSFLVMATNLLIALRRPSETEKVLKAADRYLERKNTQFDIEIVLALRSILLKDPVELSSRLDAVTKLHKQSKWLHQFANPIGKSLPYFSYGLMSAAHRFWPAEMFSKVVCPDNSIWWKDFVDLNERQGYAQGSPLFNFEGRLSFLNDIRRHFEVMETL
jgi:hypothetical protein